jgi:hypothetical protein
MEPHDLANLLGEEFVAELVAEAYAQKDNPPPDRRGKWERKRT